MVEKDNWDKLKIIINAVGMIIIPVVIYVFGSMYSNSIKESEIGLRYTELAINILSSESDSSQVNVRNWAIDVLNHYSKIKLDNNTKNELSESSILGENFVYICTDPASRKYHYSKNCRGLDACNHEVKKVAIGDAKNMDGRTLCGWED